MCRDNRYIQPDSFSRKLVDDVLDQVIATKYSSKRDASSACWQILVIKEFHCVHEFRHAQGFAALWHPHQQAMLNVLTRDEYAGKSDADVIQGVFPRCVECFSRTFFSDSKLWKTIQWCYEGVDHYVNKHSSIKKKMHYDVSRIWWC